MLSALYSLRVLLDALHDVLNEIGTYSGAWDAIFEDFRVLSYACHDIIDSIRVLSDVLYGIFHSLRTFEDVLAVALDRNRVLGYV